jgi:hypothetical protein
MQMPVIFVTGARLLIIDRNCCSIHSLEATSELQVNGGRGYRLFRRQQKMPSPNTEI